MLIVRKMLAVAAAIATVLSGGGMASAANFSFQGSFTQDDNVQAFNFTVGATSDVTLRSWSYAGGVNAAGDTIARGGFDPILALFDSTGKFINQNDDGGPGLVAADALTGRNWDTFLTIKGLAPGTYVATVMEFDNFAKGPTFADGFKRDGQGNFTGPLVGVAGGSFLDVSGVIPGHQRDNHWAFDILNVNSASTVPEPASLTLLGIGIAGMAGYRLRRRNAVAG
jgi:hypothetical protein